MNTLYGIKACDTMRKARAWLDAHGVGYGFHDYKVQGVPAGLLEGWAAVVGWEVLLNRGGTTFKRLDETERLGLDAERAFVLMRRQPSMIKRPVLEGRGRVTVGFKPEVYAALMEAGGSKARMGGSGPV